MSSTAFRSLAHWAVIILLTTLSAAQKPTASSHVARVYLHDDFGVSTGEFTAPPWACSAPISTINGWLLGNNRPDFMATNSNNVQVSGGELRCWSPDNSGTGGYLAYYHPIPALPTSWRLTIRLRNYLDAPSRAVPQVLVNVGPNSPCSLFPGDDPIGTLGFQKSDSSDELLLQAGGSIGTGYALPGDGSYHTIELISTPLGSELRAWGDADDRPAAALAAGQSLGPARRVLFGGPNALDFDYSIDFVRLEDFVETASMPPFERAVIFESFNRSTPVLTAPDWACDPLQPAVHGWLLGNSRPDFMSTNTNLAQVTNGLLRCWTTDNSGTGGYLAYLHPIVNGPTSWRLILRVKVDEAHASRPVPTIYVANDPNPGDPCNPYPSDPGARGFTASSGQVLALVDGVTNPSSGYVLPADGSFHKVELISTPAGSELRAWPTGGLRPAAPLSAGASLGVPRRVLFSGPNLEDFDYSVDFVRLYAR